MSLVAATWAVGRLFSHEDVAVAVFLGQCFLLQVAVIGASVFPTGLYLVSCDMSCVSVGWDGEGVLVPKGSSVSPRWQSAVLGGMETVLKKWYVCVGGYLPMGLAFVKGYPVLSLM